LTETKTILTQKVEKKHNFMLVHLSGQSVVRNSASLWTKKTKADWGRPLFAIFWTIEVCKITVYFCKTVMIFVTDHRLRIKLIKLLKQGMVRIRLRQCWNL